MCNSLSYQCFFAPCRQEGVIFVEERIMRKLLIIAAEGLPGDKRSANSTGNALKAS